MDPGLPESSQSHQLGSPTSSDMRILNTWTLRYSPSKMLNASQMEAYQRQQQEQADSCQHTKQQQNLPVTLPTSQRKRLPDKYDDQTFQNVQNIVPVDENTWSAGYARDLSSTAMDATGKDQVQNRPQVVERLVYTAVHGEEKPKLLYVSNSVDYGNMWRDHSPSKFMKLENLDTLPPTMLNQLLQKPDPMVQENDNRQISFDHHGSSRNTLQDALENCMESPTVPTIPTIEPGSNAPPVSQSNQSNNYTCTSQVDPHDITCPSSQFTSNGDHSDDLKKMQIYRVKSTDKLEKADYEVCDAKIPDNKQTKILEKIGKENATDGDQLKAPFSNASTREVHDEKEVDFVVESSLSTEEDQLPVHQAYQAYQASSCKPVTPSSEYQAKTDLCKPPTDRREFVVGNSVSSNNTTDLPQLNQGSTQEFAKMQNLSKLACDPSQTRSPSKFSDVCDIQGNAALVNEQSKQSDSMTRIITVDSCSSSDGRRLPCTLGKSSDPAAKTVLSEWKLPAPRMTLGSDHQLLQSYTSSKSGFTSHELSGTPHPAVTGKYVIPGLTKVPGSASGVPRYVTTCQAISDTVLSAPVMCSTTMPMSALPPHIHSSCAGAGLPVVATMHGSVMTSTPKQPSNTMPSKYRTPSASLSSLTLNSSGSEDGESPPDYRGTANTPYNTPVEGIQNLVPSTTGSVPVPSAGQLNAALFRAKHENINDFSESEYDLGRQAHNAKERARRARIKLACEHLRDLVPGMTIKTDKATVFEFAVQYIAFLQRICGTQYDKEFLRQCSPY